MDYSVLSNFSYGMYAVGVKDGNKVSAAIVTCVSQISGVKPCKIAINLNSDSYSCECIKKEKIFTLAVLSENTPGSVIGALGLVSGRNTDKLKNIRHKVLHEGVPVIKENTCCWTLCKVTDELIADDQTIFIAEIIAGSEKTVGKPMTYAYYRDVLGGSAPVDSPVYIKPAPSVDGFGGEAFICSICGYVYNDPNFGFEELPKNWVCPVCGATKTAFVRK